MGSKWWMKSPESWSSQLRILFWVKQKRCWPVLPGSFFSLKEKGSDLSHFFVVLLTEVQEEFENCEKLYVTQRILFARSKNRIGTLLAAKNHYKPLLRSERVFRNECFAFLRFDPAKFERKTWLLAPQKVIGLFSAVRAIHQKKILKPGDHQIGATKTKFPACFNRFGWNY